MSQISQTRGEKLGEKLDGKREQRQILVIILKVAPRSRAEMIGKIFNTPAYHTIILDVDPLPTGRYKGFTEEQLRDTLMFKQALRNARAEDPDAFTIVIKDNSVINVDAATVHSSVQAAVDYGSDLCYLTKWNDKCQLYTRVDKNCTASPSYVITRSPHGTQAVLFSPHGRDVVLGVKNMANGKPLITDIPLDDRLNAEIYNGNVKATCFVPNLFEFDIILNAERNSDFYKLNQSESIGIMNQTQQNTSGNLLWFILIVIVVILIAWAILALTWRKKKEKEPGKK